MKITYTTSEKREVTHTIEGEAFRIIKDSIDKDNIEGYLIVLAPKRYLLVMLGDDDGLWASVQIVSYIPYVDNMFERQYEPCSKEEAYKAYFDALSKIETIRTGDKHE